MRGLSEKVKKLPTRRGWELLETRFPNSYEQHRVLDPRED